MRHAPVVVAILAAAAVGAVLALRVPAPEAPVLQAGTALPEPRAIPEFAFTDAMGRPFGPAQFEGRWSLVFTGFTHCPDVCPTTLALMADLRRRVARDDLQFVFVSVDPERDTPEAMRRYVDHFDPAIVGVTGAQAEMERFTAGLGLAQVRNPGADGDYTVDHSTAFVLLNPKGQIAGYFQAPHEVDALAADLAGL
jgi:protein SCO1/2